jgi:hypothetical protein
VAGSGQVAPSRFRQNVSLPNFGFDYAASFLVDYLPSINLVGLPAAAGRGNEIGFSAVDLGIICSAAHLASTTEMSLRDLA